MLQSLRYFLFPKACHGCSESLQASEYMICTRCRHHLPLTQSHVYNDALIQKVFYGRILLEQATALFYFEKKGPVQALLHNLKYRGQEEISAFLGDWLGQELAQLPAYQNIDVVIPVPIHPKKRKKRGYNQVTGFAIALSKHLEASHVGHVLIKSKNTKTQVFKGRFSRSDEILDAFSITENQTLAGKHILLVDDILTTGATLEACALQLLKIPKIKLSIATMAIAQ
ncbi:phosphoribosyltransferase family protein [uncultured Dokdonia sp.]|uniref:ComF family protein n=1 Tax=uncultured Dokdonia sp. TaxID=575653 RepID=UPI00261B3001|nr:phosphoribosyltransferase family protein [uncultured Dokdonia sp.]